MADERFVDIDGIRTRYLMAGSGRSILFIHGGDFDYRGLPSADAWGLVIEGLAKRFQVFAIDKLGAGKTDNPRTDDQYTMSAVTDHIDRFIAAVGLEQVVLVGHSRGALPAAKIALDRPEQVSEVILLDTRTLAPADDSVPPGFYTQFYATPASLPTVEEVRRLFDANSYGGNGNPFREATELRASHKDRPFTADAMQRMWDRHVRYFLPDLDMLKRATLERLEGRGLTQPTLLIWGRNDPSAPLSIGVTLYNMIADRTDVAELHVLNHCGHGVPREKPTETVAIIRDFMRRVGTAPAGVVDTDAAYE